VEGRQPRVNVGENKLSETPLELGFAITGALLP
jgi:hypothetical protein